MPDYTIAVNPGRIPLGKHDPCAVLCDEEKIIFGIEEERLTRRKHITDQFPEQAIQKCLDYEGLNMQDINEIAVSWQPRQIKQLIADLRNTLSAKSPLSKYLHFTNSLEDYIVGPYTMERELLRRFDIRNIRINYFSHHRCHAASAIYPAQFTEGIVLTIDGRGESESTVVWQARDNQLERIKTYAYPNSLGVFYATVTEFLGFDAFGDEGKIMGLAPYGKDNPEIENRLRDSLKIGVEYDVTNITSGWGFLERIRKLENLLGRSAKVNPIEFSSWEKDLAHTTQKLLEEIVVEITETYCSKLNEQNVALAGGVALNCKMNMKLLSSAMLEDIFVQPVAGDAGTALGAAMLNNNISNIDEYTIFLGPEYTRSHVQNLLDTVGIEFKTGVNYRNIARQIANGAIIGWFNGRMEMGPRALGNRSILADPRTLESRKRINADIKHREEWRPFAPSILKDAAMEYLQSPVEAPFMIKSFQIEDSKCETVPAVIHPEDNSVRPQIVTKDANPALYELLREFESLTGVPVLLNTSFNDHGEPIVNNPSEALKDFFGSGLDLLVFSDIVVTK